MTLRGIATVFAALMAVPATAPAATGVGKQTVVCITNPAAPKDFRSQRLMLIGPGDHKTLARKLKQAGAFTVPGPTGDKDLATIRDVVSRRVVDGVAFTDSNLKMRKSSHLPADHPAFLIGDMVNSPAMRFVYSGVRSKRVEKDGYPYFDVARSVLMNCTALDDRDK